MKKLNEALIVLDADVETAEDCIRLAGEMFEKNGYVNTGYADAVVEREKEYPTGLPGKGINIAIPHTNNKLVNEPAVGVIIPKKAVTFSMMGMKENKLECEVILPLVVKDSHQQIGMLKKMMSIIQDGELLKRLRDELAAYGDLSTMAKYAMLSRRAMEEYGTGPEVWKEISIAQRRWANLNPQASMYKKVLDDQGYYDSAYVVEPLRLLDATPNSDGGRAIVLTTAENAKAMKQKAVLIRGFGNANQTVSPYRLKALDENSAAVRSSRLAYAMAGVTAEDIDACEFYDCFTYTVEATLRDYGFFKPKNVREFITREKIGPGGDLPVNTSGGMLSEGYFMGLTPVSEAVMQLRGECGDRQLGVYPGTKKPELIMCSDNGAVFQSNSALILERGDF